MAEVDLVVIGKVGGSFGVRGEARIIPFTESLAFFERSAKLLVNGEALVVKSSRNHKKAVLIHFEGIDDPESAKKLTGSLISVSRDSLPPTQEDEYYWHDLIGMTVFTIDGKNLGSVENLFSTSANDIIQIQGPLGEALIPMVEHVVLEVDTVKKEILIDPLEGLIPKHMINGSDKENTDEA